MPALYLAGPMKPLTLPYPPSTNNLYATVRGHRVLSKEGRAFKRTVGVLALAAGMRPLNGGVAVRVDVYRKRRAGDLDNVLKSLLDALKGIAWVDDSQVERIVAERHEDPKNPRSEVVVSPAAPAGLFARGTT